MAAKPDQNDDAQPNEAARGDSFANPSPPDGAEQTAFDPSPDTPDENALSEALGDLDDDAESADDDTPKSKTRKRKPNAILCPYCGHTQAKRKSKPRPGTFGNFTSGGGDRCDVCGGLFEPLSRKATQIAMGPWFLRDKRNPFRPGCSFEVLLKLISLGQITATTVLRGPTTRQFWSIARNVPGIAHRLGYCHACGTHLEGTPDEHADRKACPVCDAEFKTPKHRNELGLAYPNRKAADSAQRSLDRQLALLRGDDMVGIDPEGQPVERHPDPPAPDKSKKPSKRPAPRTTEPADLLDDVLGIDTAPAERPEDVSALDFTPDDAQQQDQPFAPPPFPAAPTPAPAVAAAPPQEPRAAPPLLPPNPNQLPAVQPAKPWVIYLLIALNVLVGLGILAYFLTTAANA